LRGRRRGPPPSFSDRSCDRSYEPCDRERDFGGCWSRSPPPRSSVSGVNAIPLGKRKEESEELAEEETKVRVWVAHTDCAKIIGRGGRTMRDIEARSRTKLKVQREDEMDLSTKERYVDMVGTRGEQRAALELLLQLATYCREDDGEVLKDERVADNGEGRNETPHVLEVLPEEVGRVLGRKGETVKVLERDSGTKIEVDKGSGRLEIFGSREAQDRALELVLAEVSFAKGEDGTVLKDQRTRPRDQDAVELPPLRLWVRDRDAGRVIGRGGETVRDVMEKTGADIKVQKSEDMRPGEIEREIKIFGQKEQQEQALQLVLAEVAWARGPDGMLKSPPEEVPKPREERKRRRQEVKEERKEAAKDREDGEATTRSKVVDKGAGSGSWVCSTCGGDHRTKECPHATGLLGMGMHIGMQMGMQAMGMQSLHMGMGVMGPPMMPPMMPMPGIPGMPPLGPGMLPPGSSDSSCSSSSSGSAQSRAGSVVSDADGVLSSGGGGANAGDFAPHAAAPVASAQSPAAGTVRRVRERKRRRAGADDAPVGRGRGSRSRRRHRRRARGGEAEVADELSLDAPPPLQGEEAERTTESGRRREGRERRRRHHRSPGLEELPPPPPPRRGHGSRSRDGGRRAAAAAAAERGDRGVQSAGGTAKKKIHLSDL